MPIPENNFAVLLHGTRVGILRRRGAFTRFIADRSYLANPARSVLGLIFEQDLPARHSEQGRLPPWFANLLPEGQLKKWIAAQRRVPLMREVELLTEIGHDLPGAVQVISDDSLGIDQPWETETQQRHRTRQRPEDIRFSLAGVTMKFSMIANGERLTIPAVDQRGDWIVKLPDSVHPHVPHNEFAVMSLARLAGIEVPEIRLVPRDELPSLPDRLWPNNESWAYAIRRFDRDENREPVHIEDMAQVRDFYPEDKYESNYETIASLIYRRRDLPALREFARRLAFNVLIGNSDAHLKNWSLIYRNGRIPTLSPAYDLVSTIAYDYGEILGLPLLGTDRFADITLASFTALEKKLGVSADLVDVVKETVVTTVDAWPHASEPLAEHTTLKNAISDNIARCSRTLLG